MGPVPLAQSASRWRYLVQPFAVSGGRVGWCVEEGVERQVRVMVEWESEAQVKEVFGFSGLVKRRREGKLTFVGARSAQPQA